MNYGIGQQTGVMHAAAAQFAASGYAGDTLAKREGGELPAALQRLDSRIGDLRDAIDVLEGRLTGVVARCSPPAKETAAGQIKGAMQTGFGQQLDNMFDRVASVDSRVRDLIDRLEV